MKINFVDLPGQYRDIKSFVMGDIEKAIDTGSFMGSEDFEQKFADYHGSKYCVGVGSGTDALWLSLLALGIGPGDRVIVPANTYIATAFAVSHTGAEPLFVDVNPKTYTMHIRYMDDIVIDDLIGPRVKAIIPVHLYGQPAHMYGIKEFADASNMHIIEDCAQSAGASFGFGKTGTIGTAGCYSFYPAKNLGGLGQGGAIITDDEGLAQTVRELGNVGRSTGSWFDYSHIGFNSRLDALNAKFLSHCLDHLDEWNARRVEAALYYQVGLEDLEEVVTPTLPTESSKPVFHVYALKCKDKETRDSLRGYLTEKGIPTGLHYPKPCHLQDMYFDEDNWLPISERLSDTLISLPMHPNLTPEEIKYICDHIKGFYK
jgi:dTDP-4-amino-4,6-dideoxygalactose transaminase